MKTGYTVVLVLLLIGCCFYSIQTFSIIQREERFENLVDQECDKWFNEADCRDAERNLDYTREKGQQSMSIAGFLGLAAFIVFLVGKDKEKHERNEPEEEEIEPDTKPRKNCKFCSECGARIPRTAKFCSECGGSTK